MRTLALYFRIKNRASWLKIVSQTMLRFFENDLPSAAAAISYFTMLMLFPSLLVLLSFGPTIFGYAEFKQQTIKTILALLPGTSELVRQNVESTIQNLNTGIVLSAAILVIWASSWTFTVIERALNRIWGTTSRGFLHGRLLTIGMNFLLGAVLLFSALITTFAALVRATANSLPVNPPAVIALVGGYAWNVIFGVASLLLTIVLLILIYRFMPNAKVTFREAMPGAIISGSLWEAAKYGFAWLLPHFHYNLFYGSIGLAVALLTWIYISSIIMLYGAQLTAVMHKEES